MAEALRCAGGWAHAIHKLCVVTARKTAATCLGLLARLLSFLPLIPQPYLVERTAQLLTATCNAAPPKFVVHLPSVTPGYSGPVPCPCKRCAMRLHALY